MIIAVTVIAAILLDCLLGEPKRFHPLVGFGYLASLIEKRFNQPNKSKWIQFLNGMLVWLIVVSIPVVFFMGLYAIFSLWTDQLFLLDIIVLYLAIGYKSLRQHGLAVFECLSDNKIPEAREKIAMIVSRNTDTLEPTAIRQATIESVLENGSDAIFAPIFWYIVGGAYWVILYRLANTLDAMWGYKNTRFLYFGRFAARIDDVLNYIPSRLVAASYLLLGHCKSALLCWRQQAHLLDSPNAGPVMASGAGALKLLLGGDAYYHGKLKKKPTFGCGKLPENNDIKRSLFIIDKTLCLWCLFILLVFLIG